MIKNRLPEITKRGGRRVSTARRISRLLLIVDSCVKGQMARKPPLLGVSRQVEKNGFDNTDSKHVHPVLPTRIRPCPFFWMLFFPHPSSTSVTMHCSLTCRPRTETRILSQNESPLPRWTSLRSPSAGGAYNVLNLARGQLHSAFACLGKEKKVVSPGPLCVFEMARAAAQGAGCLAGAGKARQHANLWRYFGHKSARTTGQTGHTSLACRAGHVCFFLSRN